MSQTIPGAALPVIVTAAFAAQPLRLWPMSQKLHIMRALSALIEGVTRANGYEFTLTGRVFRGRAIFGDESPSPCVTILESPQPDPQAATGGLNAEARHEEWRIFVQGWADDEDRDNPTDQLYQLQACVAKRVSEIISARPSGRPINEAAYMLGGLITGCHIGPGVVRPPVDQVSSKSFFYLPLVITLAVDNQRPFA